MDGIFGMCCVNRQKDEVNDRSSSFQRPVDFIRSKPGLVRVLQWFDQIEDKFRDSLREIRRPLDEIIGVLESECTEEVIELSRGHEVTAKVIDKDAVADVLQFNDSRMGADNTSFMQRVIETIEFFRVETNQTDGADKFDFNKLMLFCLLFSEESRSVKIECLF